MKSKLKLFYKKEKYIDKIISGFFLLYIIFYYYIIGDFENIISLDAEPIPGLFFISAPLSFLYIIFYIRIYFDIEVFNKIVLITVIITFFYNLLIAVMLEVVEFESLAFFVPMIIGGIVIFYLLKNPPIEFSINYLKVFIFAIFPIILFHFLGYIISSFL